jgi:hypothetical protein
MKVIKKRVTPTQIELPLMGVELVPVVDDNKLQQYRVTMLLRGGLSLEDALITELKTCSPTLLWRCKGTIGHIVLEIDFTVPLALTCVDSK